MAAILSVKTTKPFPAAIISQASVTLSTHFLQRFRHVSVLISVSSLEYVQIRRLIERNDLQIC